jgi:PTH1 family peptidyl-tRNA hydrolase
MVNPSSAGLVVGLGNPGRRYRQTRHNIGFAVIDELVGTQEACQVRALPVEKKRICELYEWDLPEQQHPWLLCRPLTYMNLSGGAVGWVCRKYRLHPEQLLVVHDELDLAFGTVRLKYGGGLAGHRGLRSITEAIGSRDFYRLRLGIGRPNPGCEVTEYVLSPFSETEMPKVPDILSFAVQGILAFRRHGFEQALNRLRP